MDTSRDNTEHQGHAKFKVFIKAYVSEFERKLEEYSKEAAVGGIGKAGKINNALEPILDAVKTVIAGSAEGVVAGVIKEVIPNPFKYTLTYFCRQIHRKKAKNITQIFQEVKSDELRKLFVEAGSLIFYSFENQFCYITDVDDNWKRGLSKLAIDARDRSISYIYENENSLAIEALSKELLTKALILGKSKYSIPSYITSTKMQRLFPFSPNPGQTLKIQTTKCKTCDIYDKVGIKISESDGKTKYYKKKLCGNDFGYRWSFCWENENSWILEYEKVCHLEPKDNCKFVSHNELESKINQILEDINKEDPKLKLNSIHDGVDKISKAVEILQRERKSVKPFFNVKAPVKTFTGRADKLTELHEKLQTKRPQIAVSQCVAISGPEGIGKTELAREYAYTYYKSYEHSIWIDSETHESIKNAFLRVAEKLQISRENDLHYIVEDIYEKVSNSKSLFIFDNVNKFEDIQNFLPSTLSPAVEKPAIIITSQNNNNWNIGEAGDVEVMLLEQFTPDESLSFVKKVLEIKDEDKSNDTLISQLTEELDHFPLALRKSASCIKATDNSRPAIEEYLRDIREKREDGS